MNDQMENVRLRHVERSDLDRLYSFQLAPEPNRLAATRARNEDDFHRHWEKILKAPDVSVRAVLFQETLVGSISVFHAAGIDFVGYWIARNHWGKGIATQALTLLLKEASIRPLYARVAVANVGSLRVLSKCGFKVVRYEQSPATDRFTECEEAVLKLS